MDYKCTNSFTTSTGKHYSYGDKISSSDYRMLSTIEQRNFESTSSSSSSSSSSSDDDSPFGFGKPMSMAMGDMLGTGIPGGLDMDMSTPF